MTRIPLPNHHVSRRALGALVKHKNLLAALEAFHAELGDVFQIPLPGFRPVMLAGPEANRFILVEAREHLRWRAEHDPVTHLLRHGVLVEDGASHDNLRRPMQPALHRKMMEHYIKSMWQCTDSVMNGWSTPADPLDMLVEMRRIALLILMRTLFNVDFQPELKRLWEAMLRILRYISPGLWMLWPDMPRPGYRWAIQQWDDYLHQIITERRQHVTPHDDLLSLLIESDMSDTLIRDQLLTMIIAGHDTSTALLSWALYAFSRHPDVQSRARNEIMAVCGSQPPDLTQIGELHFLNQVINETLRLYPPIHLGRSYAVEPKVKSG